MAKVTQSDSGSAHSESTGRWMLRYVIVPLLVAIISAILLNWARIPFMGTTIVITATEPATATIWLPPTAIAESTNTPDPILLTAQSILTAGYLSPTLTALPTQEATAQPIATALLTPTAALPATEAATTDLPKFRCLAPAWAGYYPLMLIEAQGIDRALGFDLEIIPGGFPNQPDYSEDEMATLLQSGEIDCLFNTLDSVALRGPYGVITALVDEGAGADEIWVRDSAIQDLNGLADRKISFAANSTAEYMTYYWLAIPGLFPITVQSESGVCPRVGTFTTVPANSTQDAVQLFRDGQVDAVLGWQPEISLAQAADTRKLADDTNVRMSVDVLLVSPQSIANRHDLVQKFHEAWFQALQQFFNDRSGSTQHLVNWADQHDPAYREWMGLSGADPAADLTALLQPIAQSTLLLNQAIFENMNDVYTLLRYQQQIWRGGGRADVVEFDLKTAIDPTFVQALRGRTDLTSHAIPVNNDFSFGSRAPAIGDTQGTTLVNLPLVFDPNDTQLSENARQVLQQCIVPILQHTTNNIKIVITASSAWPGPTGTYTEEDIRSYAAVRARNVKLMLVNYQIDPSRIVEEIVIPPTERQNSLDPQILIQDRFVRVRLEESGR